MLKRRALFAVMIACAMAWLGGDATLAQTPPADPMEIYAEAEALEQSGDMAGAERRYRAFATAAERAYGPRDQRVAMAKASVALIRIEQRDFAGAEPFMRDAHDIFVESLGAGDANLIPISLHLMTIYEALGRSEDLGRVSSFVLEVAVNAPPDESLDEALDAAIDYFAATSQLEPMMTLVRRRIAVREQVFGPGALETAEPVLILGVLQLESGHADLAEPILRRALTIYEVRRGAGDNDTENVRMYVGAALLMTGREEASEQVLRYSRRQLAARSDANPETVKNVDVLLSMILAMRNQDNEAETLLRPYMPTSCAPEEVIALPTRTLMAMIIGNDLARADEAETLMREQVACDTTLSGARSMQTAQSLEMLGNILQGRSRMSEAYLTYMQALYAAGAVEQESGIENGQVAITWRSAQGEYDVDFALNVRLRLSEITQLILSPEDQEMSLRTALDDIEDHNIDPKRAAPFLNRLALALIAQGKAGEAAEALQRASALGAEQSSAETIVQQSLLGTALLMDRRYADARTAIANAKALTSTTFGAQDALAGFLDQVTATIELFDGHPDLALASARNALSFETAMYRNSGEADVMRQMATMGSGASSTVAARALWRLAQRNGDRSGAMFSEAFEVSQYGESPSVTEAMRRSNARLAAERAGAGAEWDAWTRAVDRVSYNESDQMAVSLANVLSAQTDETIPEMPTANQMATDRREAEQGLVQAEQRLRNRFPEFFDLIHPTPVTVRDLQGARGQAALLREDEALILFSDGLSRGPDNENRGLVFVVTREGRAWAEIDMAPNALAEEIVALHRSLSASGVTRAPGGGSEATQFDFPAARAFRLYDALFGNADVAALLATKHSWVIVPQGRLVSLPYAALVTSGPAAETASGEALRGLSWLGLRNALTVLPSLSTLRTQRTRHDTPTTNAGVQFFGVGNPVFDRTADPATLATVDGASPGRFGDYNRDGVSVMAAVSSLAQLPRTEDEIRQLAGVIGRNSQVVLLGVNASEAEVRRRADQLAGAGVVAFATHGLVGGNENDPISEPALALTPPILGPDQQPDPNDDGLLLASEIMTLRLSAEWVILSACNTASGGDANAPALSGLARAFFFSGARSLLVSHWRVRDDAAAFLTTHAVQYRADRNVSTAEALRLSMEELARTDPNPSVWAPFMLISGE